MLRYLLLTIFLIVGPAGAQAAVWNHTPGEQWSEAWEQKYSKWIETSVDTGWLLQKDSIFAGTGMVDCAKFVYLLRLYFSYQNGLEFAISPSALGAQKMSSRQSNWDSYPAGAARVRAFALSVMDRAHTTTLPGDTVLVALTKESLRPGIILLGDSQRTHTWLLQKVTDYGFPLFLYSTLPQSDYLYQSFAFPAPQSVFPLKQLPSDRSAGLRRFKWPQDIGKAPEQISYRSDDQMRQSYKDFFKDIRKRMAKVSPTANPAEHANQEMDFLMQDVCAKVWERVDIMIDADAALKKLRQVKGSYARFSSAEEDLYSTPQRDKDIVIAFEELDQFFANHQSQLSVEIRRRYNTVINPRWYSDDECVVTWAQKRAEPLGALRDRFPKKTEAFSSPYSNFGTRWGISTAP